MKKIFLNKKNKLEFWTNVPGLSLIKEVVPKKYSQEIPYWWKKMPYDKKNVKQCPSFPQFFSSFYIVPMWCDTKFSRNENGEIFWQTSSNQFSWTFQPDNIFLDHLPENIKNKYNVLIKANSPWRIKTPKNYSVFETSAFWNFNENFTVVPGIIDTDFFHNAINPMILLSLEKNESFTIERGTPLSAYFPFKKEKFEIKVNEAKPKQILQDAASNLITSTKFFNGYFDIQKNNNK